MPMDRRTALGVLGTLGTVAAQRASAGDRQELPRPMVPPPTMPGPPVVEPSVRVHGRMTGAKAAVAALALEGVPCVFGVPGAQNNELWDAMKGLGLPYMLVTHEGSASIMADASARVTGCVGCFAVVPGPGLTNTMTGIGEALHDSVPIVGIVTDILRGPNAPIGQVHGLPNAALMRPICKAVIEVQHQGQIPGAIHQAFRIARAGEPGPVGVIIPYNFYNLVWDYDEPVPLAIPVAFDERAFRQAVCVLGDRKKRVGIYAGLGCADASPALTAVAEMLQAPVATSVSGKGTIPDSHPLAVGWGYGAYGTRAAEKAFKHVDVVLAIGVKFGEVSTANYAVPHVKHLIHVDANPHNLGRNVPTCLKVHADAPLFLERLLGESACLRRSPSPALAESIRHDRNIDRADHAEPKVKCAVDPMVFLTTLNHCLGPNGLVFIDVTASTHWASETFELPGPRRYFTPADNQSMGWSVPASIGASRVRPGCPVATVLGDGCFLMSGLEASTAAREGLSVKFFILDDGAYHYMQMIQEPSFGRTTATELAHLNYAGLAMGMGLGYNEILANEDVHSGIHRSLSLPGPVLTRVCISYEGRDIRWLEALKASYLSKLKAGQAVRMASRVAVRSLERHPEND